MRRFRRLRSARSFAQAFASPTQAVSRWLVVRVRATGQPTRYGIAVGKRLGGAVVRNRLRRRLRAMLRQCEEQVAEGYDVIVLARQAAVEADDPTLRGTLEKLLEQVGLWVGRP